MVLGQMVKRNVVHPYHEMLCSIKTETQIIDTCKNLNKYQRNYSDEKSFI